MPWQKLSLSKSLSECGSAAVDFIVVLVPASLLALPLVSLTSVFHHAIVNQQQVYEIARFASLADTESKQAEYFRALTDSRASMKVLKLSTGCTTSVSTKIPVRILTLPAEYTLFSQANVPCEKF